MDGRKIGLLSGALAMAAISALAARAILGGTPAPAATAAAASPSPAAPTGPEVLVAIRALPVGTIIGPESFRYTAWPTDLVDHAYYLKGRSNVAALLGTVVRQEITAGQPITQGALVRPGDRGFLAAALSPGMRAVTLSVTSQAGVAGFVFPGDRVDILLTQTVAGGTGEPLRAAETILRNVRVLATDQRTDNNVNAEGKSVVSSFSSVTVEATPKIAEKLAVAQTIGALSLSLRSIADNDGDLERAIAAGDVHVPDGDDPRAERQMLLDVAGRPQDGGSSVSTGADVSRFQRATMPRPAPVASYAPAPAPLPPRAAEGGRTGPAVRIARGNAVTIIPTGGK
jgi:pilus assembly protein CpaB